VKCAASSNRRGIVVGTTTVVPDPATVSIAVIALAMSIPRMRRWRSQVGPY
jgi:hypothetical protein